MTPHTTPRLTRGALSYSPKFPAVVRWYSERFRQQGDTMPATHKTQVVLLESPDGTSSVTARHFCGFTIEPEEGQVVTVWHHEDVPLPDDLAAELRVVLDKVAQVRRKEITRKAKGHAARHEYHAHTLPAEIREGKAKRLESGKIEGASPPPPIEK